MKEEVNAFSFLVIGNTQEVSEAGEGFKRYVGIGASRILAYNPTKEKLDEIMGYESSFEPEYTREVDGEKEASIHFIIQTVPDWFPNKKQMESLKDMLKWNIGDFNYQKWMEVNSLYNDLIKILDYETDR